MKKRTKKHHPLLTRQALLAALALVVLIELSAMLGALVLPHIRGGTAAVVQSVVTALTNDARAKNDLALLKTSDVLTRAAQAKAEDMATKGYFAHNSPDGKLPWYWLDTAGYKYEYAGENLAVNFTDSEELVKAWQNSPTHNMNLLGPRYREIGIGMAQGMYEGREAVFVVQFFAAPAYEQRIVSSAYVPPQTTVVEDTQVLGANIQGPTSPSISQRIVASSKTYGGYALLTMAALFVLVLIGGWGRHHPRALAHGVLLVGFLAGIIYVNKAFVYPILTLPSETEAATIQALR